MALDARQSYVAFLALTMLVAVIFQGVLFLSPTTGSRSFFEVVRVDTESLGPSLYLGIAKTCARDNDSTILQCTPFGSYNVSVLAPFNTSAPDALSYTPGPVVGFTAISLSLNLLVLGALGYELFKEPISEILHLQILTIITTLGFLIFVAVVISISAWFWKSGKIVNNLIHSPPLRASPGQAMNLAWVAMSFTCLPLPLWVLTWYQQATTAVDEAADRIAELQRENRELEQKIKELIAKKQHLTGCKCECVAIREDAKETEERIKIILSS